jgi:hypothetical protein
MTENHPITPPPELIEQWFKRYEDGAGLQPLFYSIFQAGADQELEACLDQLQRWGIQGVDNLRNTRRPKPPSLKEQALALLNHDPANQPFLSDKGIDIIRRALEQLDD